MFEALVNEHCPKAWARKLVPPTLSFVVLNFAWRGMLARVSLRCRVLVRWVELLLRGFWGSVLRVEGVAFSRGHLSQRGVAGGFVGVSSALARLFSLAHAR